MIQKIKKSLRGIALPITITTCTGMFTFAANTAHAASQATNLVAPGTSSTQLNTDISGAVAPEAAPDTGTGDTSSKTAAPVVEAEPQRWNAHFQTTYILQTKDAMHAPYTGANSLLPGREYGWSYSATAA